MERAALHLYQLYDLSDSIDLEVAADLLAADTTRMRPIATRGGSIDMPQLPLEISMGQPQVTLAGSALRGRLHARIYDLGILSLRLMLPLPENCTWDDAADLLGQAQSYSPSVMAIFDQALVTLRETLDPAFVRPNTTVRSEDYRILLVERLGEGKPAAQLARDPLLLRVALGERRPLSDAVRALAVPLSYYEDDLMLLTWASAVVIEPEAGARDDATFLLEFANVQLLAFRTYDAEVERDLARITPRLARDRTGRRIWSGTTTRFLHEIHGLIADITDASTRAENALKVTEDVYWNRVYTAALSVLRVEVWRTGIAEGLSVLRQTASLLNDEVEAARTTLLEGLVILLILLELIVAVLGLRH